MTGFGRSNSLSINTSGSLFGNNATTGQGQQSAGLFGSSTNASTQPATAGGLFGSTSQPQSGGLFGGASAGAASQPPQSGGLFGGAQQASQPQSAGLFGNLNKPAAPAASGSGLFGSSAAAPQTQSSGGLFGGALGGNAQGQNQNANQTQASQTGGLFSNAGQAKPSLFGSSTAQQTATPSLFGGNTNQQQNQTSAPSLFGASQQQQQQQNQPQQQNSLFGGMNPQNKPLGGLGSTAGGLGAGQSPVQHRNIETLKGTTRFHELHPDIQKVIQDLDDGFHHHMSNSVKCREAMTKSEVDVASIAPDVAYIEDLMATVETGLVNDSSNIAQLKDVIKKDAADALLSFRAIENHKLPAQYHYGNRTNLNSSTTKATASNALDDDDDPNKPVDLVNYFSRRTGDLSRTLDVYQRQIREIEAHLRTMEAGTLEKAQQLSGNRNASRDQRKELVEAMKAIEGAILDSAKKVGQTRDLVNQQTLGGVGGA